MSQMKIVLLDSETSISPQQLRRFEKLGRVTYINQVHLSKDAAIRLLGDADIAAIAPTSLKPVDREIIEACPRLKGIALVTTGFDYVDLQAAAERNIPVCNIPRYSTESVAEHTFGLIFALSKHICQASQDVKSGPVSFKNYFGWEIFQKTLGIIGLGDVGTRVAQIAQTFEMKILAVRNASVVYTRSLKKYPMSFSKGVIPLRDACGLTVL